MSDELVNQSDHPVSENEETTVLGEPTTVFPAVADSEVTTVLPEATQEEHTPPSIEPEEPTINEGKPPRSKKRTMLIVAGSVIAALVLAGGVYAGVAVHENEQTDSAYQSSLNADSALAKSITTATPLAKTDKSKVADQNVLTTLNRALKNAKSEQGVEEQSITPALLWQVLDAKQAYTQDTDNADTARTALDKAVKLINESIALKQLNDAKQALTDKINGAKQALADSDGNVQDNATRDALSQAIDNASKVLAGKQATVKALQDEAGKLDNAINTVNQNMEAKRQADEEAARKAAEEAARQAQAAAAQAQQSYSTPRYSYRSGGYSGGGNYSAPRYTGNSGGGYSAPSTPSTGGGFVGGIGGGHGVGSANDCDAACRAPIVH